MASEEQRAIEAILRVAEEPVAPNLLAQLLEVPQDRIDELCAGLAQSYENDDRGFVLVKVAGGYRFQTHPDLAPYVERFALEGQSARMSPAGATGQSASGRSPCSSTSTISGPGMKSATAGRSSMESSPSFSRNIGVVP